MWPEMMTLLLYVTCTSYLITRTNTARHDDARRSSLCGPISASPATRFSQERKEQLVATRWEHQNLRCSFPESLVRLNIGEQHDDGRFRVTIHACPNVTRIMLRVSGAAHLGLQDANFVITGRARLVSCDKGNGTVLVNHPTTRQVLWIIPSRHDISQDIRVIMSYQYQPQRDKRLWSIQSHGTVNFDRDQAKSDARTKRSTAEDTKVVKLQQLEGCGKRKSCIRFGNKGCSHLQCDYLLSYSITNRSFLELEISGKTDGWVALGLSSDDKMGGDDVIVCKLKSAMSNELEALPMSMAVPYNKPRAFPKNDITLVHQIVQDGHIYCKIKKNLTDSGTSMDLTNNWFQFYAKGKNDLNGNILKHKVTPPTSLDSVSMLRPHHVESTEYKELSSSAISVYFHRFRNYQVVAMMGLITVAVIPK